MRTACSSTATKDSCAAPQPSPVDVHAALVPEGAHHSVAEGAHESVGLVHAWKKGCKEESALGME